MPLIPSYDLWIKDTTPSMSFGVRSSDLRAVDSALKAYWTDQTDLSLEALKQALLAYEQKKSHFEPVGDSLYGRASRNWRGDIRNKKGTISLLHDALFFEPRAASETKDAHGLTEKGREEYALQVLREANEDPVRKLLSGKEITVKKTAIAQLAYSTYDAAKEAASQIALIPLPRVDPIHLIRVFIEWIKFKLPTFNIEMHLPNLLGWYKGLNLGLPDINFPELFIKWLRLNIPDLNIYLPDVFAYLKFKFPALNLNFLPNLNITLPRVPSITIDLPHVKIPQLDFVLPSLPDIRLDLSIIFGIDFRILELFPDLLAELVASFRDIYLECVPFLGPAKSTAKAVIGYSKAILARFNVSGWNEEKAGVFAKNGASDAFDAVIAVIIREANRTAALASVDLATAGAQTGGIFLDGGVATGAGIAAGNRIAKFLITVQIFITEYKEMQKANQIMQAWADGGTQTIKELFEASPLLGCFVIWCSDTSAILEGVVENFGQPGYSAHIDTLIKKSSDVKDYAYAFVSSSRFEIAGLPTLPRQEENLVATLAAMKNAYEFRAKGVQSTGGALSYISSLGKKR